MPGGRDLDNSTLAALTVYVQSLHIAQASSLTSAGENTAQTAVLFEKNCSSCHGETGQGDGPVLAAWRRARPTFSSNKATLTIWKWSCATASPVPPCRREKRP